jgi:cytochrome c oxidase assembly factor CtaG/cytochrome c2
MAHGAHEAGQLPWTFEPGVLAPLALALALYLLGLRRMGAAQRRRIVGGWRCAAFIGGIVTLFIALESPLDALADDLFSAHMGQHLLLLMVAPPLLVTGRPAVAWLWAFDVEGRRTIGHAWKRSGLQAAFHGLTRPLPAWLLWTASLCFWHLPGAYDFAERNGAVHDFEHLCFLGFALAVWTIIVAPYGRRALGYGATMLYVISLGFEMGMIGAILTFASQPLYTAHLNTTAAWGLSPLQDQQLAGVIMWIPTNMIHLGTLCALFAAWFRESERRAVAAAAKAALPVAALRCALVAPLVLIALAGCSGKADPPPEQTVPGASAARGAKLIQQYGCGGCHTIPGIGTADGVIAPPLTKFSDRMFISGVMNNEPQNLVYWIRFPQNVIPGVDMPDMGVTQKDAKDIAAYLYTLH